MNKLSFIVLIRGGAALLVVITHYTLLMQDNYALTMSFKPIKFIHDPNTLVIVSKLLGLGMFATNSFFLISGFCILASLDKNSPKNFIYLRFFRIYPVLIIAIILYGVIPHIYTTNLNIEKTPRASINSLLWGLTLFDDLTYYSCTQYQITWTLQIEWKFYIFCALMTWFKLQLTPKNILYFVSISFVLIKLLAKVIYHKYNVEYYDLGPFLVFDMGNGLGFNILSLIGKMAFYISYMAIGCLVYHHHKNNITTKKLILSVIYIMALLGIFQNINFEKVKGVITPIILFLTLYFYAPNMKLNKMFSFLGDISYPLYLLHPLGYHITTFFIYKLQINVINAYVLNILLIFTLSYAVHRYVEKPMINYSKNKIKGVPF